MVGRIWRAGRQFDTPDIVCCNLHLQDNIFGVHLKKIFLLIVFKSVNLRKDWLNGY